MGEKTQYLTQIPDRFTADAVRYLLEKILAEDRTLVVGKDGTGYDVKFYGDTSGAYMLWDQSADALLFDKADIHLGDTDFVMFGDAAAGDVSINWTGSILQIAPAADDTGSINVGNGTADIDVKIFLNATTKYVLFDVGNSLLTLEDVDLRLGDSDALQFGDSQDITMQWNGSTFGVAAIADSQMILGGSQYQIDLRHYGDIEGHNNEADATGYTIAAYKSRGTSDTALSDNDVIFNLTGYGYNDNATPAVKTLGSFKLLMTDVTDGTEDGAFVFEAMVAGAAAAEKFRIADILTASTNLTIGTSASKLSLTASNPLLAEHATTALTTGNFRVSEVNLTMTGAATLNTIEAFSSIVTSNVQTGNWCNAILGKVDYSTSGFVTGLAGVVCAELDMPAATIGNGSYTCFEAELNCPTGALGWGASVPVSFLNGNVWGAGVAEFRDDGYIFNFTGLSTATAGKVFDECTAAAASHALRILIDGVPYYIMLNSNVDA